MDNPSDMGDHESVAQVFTYLSGLSDKQVHRSCSMNHIHYPVNLQTTQGQAEVEGAGEAYQKSSHSVECRNIEGFEKLPRELQNKIKPEPPYYWNTVNVTCRDWKIRYCCENLWGEPSLYDLVRNKAEKPVPKSIAPTDVFVDPPTKKTLFEDCEWRDFIRYEQNVSMLQHFK